MPVKVLFKKDVKDVARAGEVKDVADGYARNFLLPRGLAVVATAGTLKQVEQLKAANARHAAEEQQVARDLQARLEAQPVVLSAKAGAQGRLYGSVTSADVVEAVRQQHGVELERREIELPEAIRQVGSFTGSVRLHRNVSARLTLDVRALEAG